jgi:hypothetical protein
MVDQLAPAASPVAESILNADHSECHAHERHGSGLACSCQPASSFGKENLKWSGTIDNVSTSGIGLLLGRRFEKGTGLAIELPGSADNGSYVVLAKVVNVSRQSNSFWMLGCKFVSELSDDEVGRLLPRAQSSIEPPSALNETALPPALTELARPAAAPQSTKQPKIFPIYLVVQTAAGKKVGCMIPSFEVLSCSWPLAPGKVGALKGVTKQGNPWKLRVKVRQCDSEGDTWKLECRLANSTSDADLLGALGELISTN